MTPNERRERARREPPGSVHFSLGIDGRVVEATFHDSDVVEVVGEHAYYWYLDRRLDWSLAYPVGRDGQPDWW